MKTNDLIKQLDQMEQNRMKEFRGGLIVITIFLLYCFLCPVWEGVKASQAFTAFKHLLGF